MSEEKPKRDRTRKGGSRKPTGSLVDMRYVLKFPPPPSGEESPNRAFFRKLKETDPPRFAQLLMNAEKTQRQLSEASRGDSKAAADVGAERALQAIDGMLADWDAKQVG